MAQAEDQAVRHRVSVTIDGCEWVVFVDAVSPNIANQSVCSMLDRYSDKGKVSLRASQAEDRIDIRGQLKSLSDCYKSLRDYVIDKEDPEAQEDGTE